VQLLVVALRATIVSTADPWPSAQRFLSPDLSGCQPTHESAGNHWGPRETFACTTVHPPPDWRIRRHAADALVNRGCTRTRVGNTHSAAPPAAGLSADPRTRAENDRGAQSSSASARHIGLWIRPLYRDHRARRASSGARPRSEWPLDHESSERPSRSPCQDRTP
jgi:hypothetical protein